MLFNSVEYLFFFIGVVSIFFLIPAKLKWIHLLAVSIYFYACWRIDYLVLLIATIMVSYFCARGIETNSNSKYKKTFLYCGLICNYGQLFVFKYFDFTIENANLAFSHFNIYHHFPYLQWALPIGISFHVFQITGYLFDAYNGKIKAEKHLGIFSLFVCFFPQLVAGPIEKGSHLLPQLKKYPGVKSADITFGLQLMLWGAFQKIVIADNLAIYVKTVFADLTHFSFFPILLATVFFTVQIYCDFAGYSSIARGTARVMGYDLVVNFNKPYFSKSITDFWRRWHISLSIWFRDYLYIPLGGNREGNSRTYFNLFLVFLFTGIWHGASWNFIAWGLFHGAFLIIERIGLSKILEKLANPIRYAYTIGIVVIGWIFFRAENFTQAVSALKTIFTFDIHGFGINVNFKTGIFGIALNATLICLLFFIEWLDIKKGIFSKFFQSPIYLRWPIYFCAIMLILVFGNMDHTEFIYFQF